jgi:hypothetical protein
MIDKSLYKDKRLSKTEKKKIKPVNQGGGPNYLGKQETVTVPKKWLSDPDHVVAELAYITPREKKILLEKNLYGSLKGKPNRGPAGVQSLQGDMGSVGGGNSSGGNSGGVGGGDARDRGMGMAGKTGNFGPTSSPKGDGGNKFTSLTKDVLNPNVDFVGNTVFGPTQKYSGSGFLSGYRNIDPITGQPKMGLAYLGDRMKALASRVNPFSVIGGLVAGPFGSILGQGFSKLGALRDYDTLADYAKGELGLFKDEDEDEVDTIDIRDKYNRMGIMNPNLITPQPKPGINFINVPQDYYPSNVPTVSPQEYDFFSNAMAEITDKDIQMMNTPVGQMMDYDTFKAISGNESLTPQEFEQLKSQVG